MIKLPASLERRLEALFPRVRDREQFVADAVGKAVEEIGDAPDAEDMPDNVGGTLHLFSDGGSRGNPGQAAIGYIIEDPARGVILKQHSECIGVETNNIAEYRALIEGLRAAERYHPNRLICHLDSELIVKQLSGEYRVKMPALEPLFQEVRQLSMNFPDIVFRHIPRSDNYRADALVNKALNEQARTFRPAKPNPGYEQSQQQVFRKF